MSDIDNEILQLYRYLSSRNSSPSITASASDNSNYVNAINSEVRHEKVRVKSKYFKYTRITKVRRGLGGYG